MGVHDQPQKFCKVTVHRSDSFRPWEHTSMTRTTRSHSSAASRATVTYKPHQVANPAPSKTEISRWTATGNAAIDGLDMPTRRRAHTTATAAPMRHSARMDPLSRLTMRFEQDNTAENQDGEPVASMAVRTDSFLRVDTEGKDPVRQTFDEDSRMFVPATPPIPSGLDVEFLPTADYTPEIPSVFKRALESEDDAYMSPTGDSNMFGQSRIRFSSPTAAFAQSRIRISTPGKTSSLYGDSSDYMDELPTPIMSSSVGTPLEDHALPMTQSDLHDEDLQVQKQEDEAYPSAEPFDASASVFNQSSSYEEIRLSAPRAEPVPVEVEVVRELPMKEEPELEEEEEEEEEQEEQLIDEDAENVSSFVEVEDEQNDVDLSELDEGGFDVCDNFDAILGEPLPDRGSRWRFSLGPKKSFVRQKRGMSSPPRMISQPPINLARHMSVPAAYTPPHQTSESIRPKPIVHAPEGTPLYHGQTLHLVFKGTDGRTTQVSTSQRRSKSSVFSKLIECFSTDSEPFASPEDALRIIAHTSEGDIRGGDRISLARGDGSVLRIQKLSKKLSFSPKIDMKAKFVVCGVPEGTVVTDTTKFYLQSVYDRTKTVGFLRGRHAGTGCLVLYQYRTTDDKSEPIQFFKREDPPSFAQMHAVQQGHAPLTTSPLMGGFM